MSVNKKAKLTFLLVISYFSPTLYGCRIVYYTSLQKGHIWLPFFKPLLFQLLVLLVSFLSSYQTKPVTAPSKAGNAWSADMPITWAEDERVKFLEDKSKLYLEWQHWNLENLEMLCDELSEKMKQLWLLWFWWIITSFKENPRPSF